MEKKTTLAATLGAAFLASAIAPLANAGSSPFAAADLQSGYSQINLDQHEGKCGEGKCGEEKKKQHEGKCGEGDKKEEGKCGEGKCGANKKAE